MDQIENMLSVYWPYLVVPVLFLAIVAWIYRPTAKRRYETDGKIPLERERSDAENRQNSAR